MKNTPTNDDGTTTTKSGSERRVTARGQTEVHERLSQVEEVTRANRRELDLQFQRIAQIQAGLDRLLKLCAGATLSTAADEETPASVSRRATAPAGPAASVHDRAARKPEL